MGFTRYTLRYNSTSGPIVLYNLLNTAVEEIRRAQEDLGSKDFVAEVQGHNYSQQEIDLLRSA